MPRGTHPSVYPHSGGPRHTENIFFAAVNGTSCFCGTNIMHVGRVALPDSACTTLCSGDPSESRCGGVNGSVAAVWDLASARGSAISPPFWSENGAWCSSDNFSVTPLNSTIPSQLVRRAPLAHGTQTGLGGSWAVHGRRSKCSPRVRATS
jgi:hypothetical protein